MLLPTARSQLAPELGVEATAVAEERMLPRGLEPDPDARVRSGLGDVERRGERTGLHLSELAGAGALVIADGVDELTAQPGQRSRGRARSAGRHRSAPSAERIDQAVPLADETV